MSYPNWKTTSSIFPIYRLSVTKAYLEVAKNFPFGENCKCLTRAECAARSWVVSKLFNFGTNAATLELFNNAGGSVCLRDRVPSDEIVRCR